MSATHALQSQIQHIDREIASMLENVQRRRRERDRLVKALEMTEGIKTSGPQADAASLVRASMVGRSGRATTDQIARDVHKMCPQYAVQKYRAVRRKVQVYLSRWEWVKRVDRGTWELLDG
jgi:hypothetical protein